MFSSFLKMAFFSMVLVVTIPTIVNARTSFPEFSLSGQANENITEASPSISNESSVAIRRPLTRDILVMQEQINILEALIKRQSEIGKIAESYQEMGIPFVQPRPELSACKKLPLNMLCLYSYPDLGANKKFFENSLNRFEERQDSALEDALASINDSMMTNVQIPSMPNNSDFSDDMEGNDDIGSNNADDRLLWSDIRCIQSDCTALISYESDMQKRFRVSEGDIVDGNLQIMSISPTKMTAKDNDNIIEIEPLALDGRTQKTRKAIDTSKNAQKSDIIDDIIVENSIEDTNNIPQPIEEQTLLGPTGLF